MKPPGPAPIPGERFGILTVLDGERRAHDRARAALVRCDCGEELIVRLGAPRAGLSRSCGCRAHAGKGSRRPARELGRPVPVHNAILAVARAARAVARLGASTEDMERTIAALRSGAPATALRRSALRPRPPGGRRRPAQRVAVLEAALRRVVAFGHAAGCEHPMVPVYECCCYAYSQGELAAMGLRHADGRTWYRCRGYGWRWSLVGLASWRAWNEATYAARLMAAAREADHG